MSEYLVWNPDEGETEETARKVRGKSARVAAIRAAAGATKLPEDMCEVMDLMVKTHDGSVFKVTVEIEHTPSFHGNLPVLVRP